MCPEFKPELGFILDFGWRWPVYFSGVSFLWEIKDDVPLED